MKQKIMQFYDEVQIHIESGRGGDGLASGRREAKMAFGGPNGGDGGKGGDLVFLATKDEDTLLPYKYKKTFKAQSGEPGRTKDQYGANGESLVLNVPVGTIIKDEEGNIIKQLSKDGERWVALKGGEGGMGNIHFKDSVNQYPTFALLGEPARKKNVTLELQLLADVALIGSPSVGKSSLINSVSNTKAKIGDYPFTTIVPNLGSISVGDFHFNMIDIPGLIKGAAEGKGLGNDFLRHILKSRIFCFIGDLEKLDNGLNEIPDLLDEIVKYIHEKVDADAEISLEERDGGIVLIATKFDEVILFKKIIFALNKYDLINDDEIVGEYKKQFLINLNNFTKKELNFEITADMLEKNCFVVSAASHYGLDKWINKIAEILKKSPAIEHIFDDDVQEGEFKDEYNILVKDITSTEKQKLLDEGYIDEIDSKYNKVREVRDPEFCKRVFITQWGNEEGEMYFWKMMNEIGFMEEFENSGIKKGDVIKVKSYYDGEHDRYILF